MKLNIIAASVLAAATALAAQASFAEESPLMQDRMVHMTQAAIQQQQQSEQSASQVNVEAASKQG
jgi:hypothetical protein